ncbi:lipopolysaccharide biosynthesis protein [Vibrio campbellii]
MFLLFYALLFITSNTMLLFFNKACFTPKKYSASKFLFAFKRMYKPSLVLFFNAVVVYFSFVIDRFVIDYSLGRSVLGEYSVIIFVFSTFYMIPSILVELIFPKIVKESATSNKVFFRSEMLVTLSVTSSAVFLGSIVVYFFINEFTEYSDLTYLMNIIALGVIPYSITSILHHSINAKGKHLLILKTNFIGLCFYSLLMIGCFELSLGLKYFVFSKVAYSYFVLILFITAAKGITIQNQRTAR